MNSHVQGGMYGVRLIVTSFCSDARVSLGLPINFKINTHGMCVCI